MPTFSRHPLFVDQAGDQLADGFPFETVLSFSPIIAHWRRLSEENPATYAAEWAELERDLDAASDLLDPIDDLTSLDRYDRVIRRLVRPLFPSSSWTSDLRVLHAPFGGPVVCRTERYVKAMGRHSERALDAISHHDVYTRTLYAYRAILRRLYGVTMRLDQPIVFMVPDEEGLKRYFKLNSNAQFADVESTGALPELSQSDVDELLQNVSDLSRWTAKLPPNLFRFVGASVTTLTDVTHEMATAAITHLVLRSDANVTEENFDALQAEVRNLFRTGSLRLGLASLQADGALNVRSERRIWNSLVIRDALREGTLDWRGTCYDHALRQGRAVVIPDVGTEKLDESLKRVLLKQQVRSLALHPLRYGDRTVGLFELSSGEPRVVDASTLLKMQQLQAIFGLVVHQNLERFETRVESAIQQTFTAIHPSVQWRFREGAIAMLESKVGAIDLEPVVFESVYPLYGAADIRSSTRHRDEAVRHDALDRLGRARETLKAIREVVPLTILDELSLRLERRTARCEAAWSAGDDREVARFLADEIEPVLQTLTAGRDELAPLFEAYCTPNGGTDTQRSTAYETSRREINRLIADVLVSEQAEAQRLFPHYFEHAKTDGVEHTMYIGASISPDHPFDLAYVQNLRLRQLIAACRIAQGVRRLNETLPMRLDVAQLIVVQHAPITVRFRIDEKRFDVDGASGVRFEMLKKRLDKAHVKGSSERITQPESVAVVYSTEAEESEYRHYADYLAANGYVEAESEVLEVEDLPGAVGLRMRRLSVRDSISSS